MLRQLAEEVGLVADEAVASLSDQQLLKEYEEEIQTARRKGCHGNMGSNMHCVIVLHEKDLVITYSPAELQVSYGINLNV